MVMLLIFLMSKLRKYGSFRIVFVKVELLNLKKLVGMKYKNNPFNIRYTGQQWKGLAGHKNGFCEFDSLDYGIRAWLILMRTYRRKYNICTIRKILWRYAPPCENHTSNYMKTISVGSHIPIDKYLNFNDEYFTIGRFMAVVESATNFSNDEIRLVAQKFNISIVS